MSGEDSSPDFYWDTKGKVTKDGYTLEARASAILVDPKLRANTFPIEVVFEARRQILVLVPQEPLDVVHANRIGVHLQREVPRVIGEQFLARVRESFAVESQEPLLLDAHDQSRSAA